MAAPAIRLKAGHIESGTPRERQQKDPLRINTVDNEMGNAMGQRLGFARPCTRDHQQRPRIKGRAIFYAMLNSTPLFLVQVSQIVVGHLSGD
jgi:hypothetical protein